MTPVEILRSFIGKTVDQSPSPFMRYLRPVIVAVDEGAVEMQYTVRPEWLNPAAILHGGMVAAIIDDCMGAAVYTLGEAEFFTTINNTVDYFAPAKEKDKIYASAKVIKRGKTVLHVECLIYNEDRSKILVRGNSNLLRIQNAGK